MKITAIASSAASATPFMKRSWRRRSASAGERAARVTRADEGMGATVLCLGARLGGAVPQFAALTAVILGLG